MSENPYQTPDSNLDVPELLEQRPIRGIVLGLVADLGGTTLCSVVLVLIYGSMLASQGMNAADIEQTLSSVETFSLYGNISTLFGLAMSFLGGYVCIRVSNGVDLTNPIALGVITFLVAVLLAWDAYDPIEFVLLSAVSFMATLWGGRAALNQRLKGAAIQA